MPVPARNTLAVIGAGPIGLEAALAALDRGFDVHVFERGEVGAHPIAWGHVPMFTPWRMNVGPAMLTRMQQTGGEAPDPEAAPTGLEYAERLLQPLAALPELKDRLHLHAQVVAVSRQGALKADAIGKPERSEHPFRLLVRDAGGRESLLHAFSVIDASGTYGQPNWAGDGGIPARGEMYLRPQMTYHVEDVLGVSRARYAGKRTLVVGGGASAATTVTALARLAEETPGTTVAWATREPVDALYLDAPDDPLVTRRALYERARTLLRDASGAVTHVGGMRVEGLEFNSATHRYRVTLMQGEQPRVEEVDHVIVNAGFGPDDSLYRELQVHECYATRAPMRLATALLGAAGSDCLQVPAFGVGVLENPEPDFFILGAKSYGRDSRFLLQTGFTQVADVMAHLAKAHGTPVEA